MTEVFDKFVLCSLATINTFDRFKYSEVYVSVVISLGCEPDFVPETVAHYKYLSVRDECDQYMIDLWLYLYSNALITLNLGPQSKVLVHCVHGQSRSAATILALHMLTTSSSFDESFLVLKMLEPGISINPSFLSQLIFLDSFLDEQRLEKDCSLTLSNLSCIKDTLSQQYRSEISNTLALDSSEQEFSQKIVLCKQCKGFLASDLDMISTSLRIGDDLLHEKVDDYWRDWIAYEWKTKRLQIAPIPDYVHFKPLQWMTNQVNAARIYNSTSEQLHCPYCSAAVGKWNSQLLNVLCPYLPVDSYSLTQRNILLQRKRK